MHGSRGAAAAVLRACVVKTPARSEDAVQRRRLAALVRDNFFFMWRFLRRVGVPEQEIADAVQSVFLVVSEKCASIVPGNEKAFLYGAARRVAANARRRTHTRNRDVELESASMPAPSCAPDDDAELRHARRILDQVLVSIPVELRIALVLAEIEGMSASEIAAVTDVPVPTVRSRLRRAREMFRDRVSKNRGTLVGFVALWDAGRRELPPPEAVAQLLQRLGVRPASAAPAASQPPAGLHASPWAVGAGIAGAGIAVAIGLALWAATPRDSSGPTRLAVLETAAQAPAVTVETQPVAADTASASRAELASLGTTTPFRPALPTSASVPVRADPLVAEVSALDSVRSATAAGQPARALALLDRYDHEFPNGKMAPEAGYLRIRAMMLAGDQQGARVQAEQWLKRWPGSAFARQVREAAGL